MRHTLIVLLFTSVLGCTSTQISIHTNPPGADVYSRPVGGGEYKHFGKTPVYLTNAQLEKANNGSGPVQVEIRMEGFKTDDFIVTEISLVNLNINRELQPKRDYEMQAWLNQHVTQMFEVRQLVQNNRYKEALQIIRRLKEQTPMVATLHQMEGGIQLLLRDYAAALQAYRTAARLDPENAESVKMTRQLERTYGYRKEVDLLESDFLKQQQQRQPASPAGSP